MKTTALALLALIPLVASPMASRLEATPNRIALPSYDSVISRVANMVRDPQARRLAQGKKLGILNVMWEDTGRWQGSSLGPNISDVTIEVHHKNGGRTRRALMPVIRFPNFKDKTADIRLDRFFIRVGNHRRGGRLETISLKNFLKNPSRYMSLPRRGRIRGNTLLARRDKHVLVSAQSAFLPIPRQGKATFYPVIFNYQSRRGHPAVLTLLVTRQGTSMTIIDNTRDNLGSGSWGQRLFFNKLGQRAPLQAERLSDVKRRGTTRNGESAASLGADSNLLMLIQVPLKYKPLPRRKYSVMSAAPMGSSMKFSVRRRGGGSNVERAVLGHGKTVGPYTELDGLTIERDARFPIRVTVQFYLATSNGVINQQNIDDIASQISQVYSKGDYVGSLVVPTKDRRRPTEWTGSGPAPKRVTVEDFPGLTQWCRTTGARRWFCRRRQAPIGIR